MRFDRDQALKFIDLGDRDVAPFFAGRVAEIRHFESAFNTLDWENKRAAAFRIFQGAPGCGKTSLVEHIRQRHSDDTLFVDIRRGHLVSEEALIGQIRQTAVSVGSLTGRAIAAFGQAVGAYLRVARPGGDDARNFAADRTTRNAKVVLFMDEAQLVDEDQQPGLGLLHTSGLGFPTIAVFAGLSHTSGRLRSIGGLSRLPDNAIVNMGAMRESECAESTARLLEAYGAVGDDSEKEQACATVAHLSRGWPQHLHGAQRALCRELVRTDGVLDRVDFNAVDSESDRTRHEYYVARLSDTVLDLVPDATAEIVSNVSDRRPRGMYDLEGLCEEAISRLGLDKERRFRASPEEFAAALVERGVLAISPGGGYDVAIPSMFEWLTSATREHPG